MDHWLRELQEELDGLEDVHRLRTLEPVAIEGRWVRRRERKLINLSGNNYLALAGHPHLRDAAIDAVRRHGTGAGASRLISGHHHAHAEIEERFARFKHAEAALLCPTGYMANLAALGALAGRDDLIFLDKLNHASLIDAARASGAAVRVFPHRDVRRLERLLARHTSRNKERRAKSEERFSEISASRDRRSPRTLIVTDSVFSMDGDCADLPALCDLADRYDAILVVDEAHATGVLGPTGAGLCEAQGVQDRVDVVTSTASKALGGLGGIITGWREVIQTAINRSRSFIYTTAVPPAQVATIGAALDIVRDEPERRTRLGELARMLRHRLIECGWPPAADPVGPDTPIVPLLVGESRRALHLADHLERAGYFAPAIRPPTVAPGSARVRLSLRADLEESDLAGLVAALDSWRATAIAEPVT